MKAKNNRLIISLYDYTTAWARPYIDAGYPVIVWDKKIEGCILEKFSSLLTLIEEIGLDVYGILAAPPCTDFASSGARWMEEKDKPSKGYEPFESTTEKSTALVYIVLHMVDILKPKFWAIENPVGRIERLVPEIKPYRNLIFNPDQFGDPYTKKTILWGEFNNNLQKDLVLPLFGSMISNICAGTRRSKTPSGFAKAFYEVNK